MNRRHKLPALMDLLRRHYGSGNSGGRRVLVEYTMLAGVNDSLGDARRLLELLEGVEAKVGEGGGWGHSRLLAGGGCVCWGQLVPLKGCWMIVPVPN